MVMLTYMKQYPEKQNNHQETKRYLHGEGPRKPDKHKGEITRKKKGEGGLGTASFSPG